MDRYLVISSDCHAGLPPQRYREYLEPRYRDAFDRELPLQLARTEESEKQFLVKDINDQWRQGIKRGLTGAWDHDERVKVLDGDGVAGEIIFCDGITEMNSPPFGAGLGLQTEGVDPELQWAGARAHNRWLAELCSMAPERHCGVAVVPALWDVDLTVGYVRELREAGLRTIMIPVVWGRFPPYHHPCYEPLWSVCEDLEVVINFHSGATPRHDHFGDLEAEGAVERPGAMGVYLNEVKFFLARPITYLIWGGVFERHPKLRVAFTEGTTNWAPEMLANMDRSYEWGMRDQKLGNYRAHLSMKPSEYFARNIAIGASCARREEIENRHQVGVGQIMWGSDYPHPEGAWPHTREQMCEALHGVPEEEIEAMLGGNAARFYAFDREKLAPLVARIGPDKSWFRGPALSEADDGRTRLRPR